jgi:hypothetical protein
MEENLVVSLCEMPFTLPHETPTLTDRKIRDRHIAAALGCPMHIQEADCDVEMLEETDFSDGQLQDASYGLSARPHALYMIQMTELSVVCEYCF